MPRIIRTSLVEEDLFSIWDYIAEDSIESADRVVRQISSQFDLLASNPLSGTPREELAPSLRSIPTGHYIIFYMPIKNGVEIIRILHGAVDVQAKF